MLQGSREWLDLRKQYVTATDCGIILGLSPYKTAFRLWRQKMDLDPPDEETEIMREGTRLEPIARKWLAEVKGIYSEPSVVFKDFMMASLDGIFRNDFIVEIKCGSKSFSQAQDGIIPEYYICQMQHQMYVSNVQLCYYVAFNGKEGIVIPVVRDDNFINEMLPKLKEFYQCLLTYTPPMMITKDYQTRSDQEWNALADSYRNAYRDRKNAEQLEQDLKNKLISLAGEQSSMGNGIRLSKIPRKGAINYSTIPALKGLNLDEYRNESSEYWRISVD